MLAGGPRGGQALQPPGSPGTRLVPLGFKTEDFVCEWLHFQDCRDTCSAERIDFSQISPESVSFPDR